MRTSERLRRDVDAVRDMDPDGVDVVRVGLETEMGELAAVLYESLDPDTYRVYRRLRSGLDGRGGDPRAAARFVARRKYSSIEGVDLAEEVAAYGGDERRWFLESREGRMLADETVPLYVELSVPSDEELRLVGRAAFLLLRDGDGEDPFLYHKHREGCEREIWDDFDAGALAPLYAIDGVACLACSNERALWTRILDDTKSTRYGTLAQAGLELYEQNELLPGSVEIVTVWDYQLMRTVATQQRKIDKKRMLDLQKKAAAETDDDG